MDKLITFKAEPTSFSDLGRLLDAKAMERYKITEETNINISGANNIKKESKKSLRINLKNLLFFVFFLLLLQIGFPKDF